MKILLAIDGSAHGAVSVRELARQHVPADSEVRVLSVVDPIPPTYTPTVWGEGLNIGSFDGYQELAKMAAARAQTVVDQAAATLRADAGSE